MPYIDLSGARLYYEIEGAGKEDLVFGHSLLFNLRMFDDQVAYLKSDFRCIRFDFRGQGKSEVTTDGYDLDSLTNDIIEFVKNLCPNPCHFVGFSMGGMVGMRLAIRNPELIRSLILINTSSDPEPKESLNQNLLLAWIGRNLGLSLVANKVMSKFFSSAFLKDVTRNNVKETWKKYFLANDQVGVSRAIHGVLKRESFTSVIHQINVPTLILGGEKDILTPIDKSKIMHGNIKNSKFKVVPKAAHMSPVEEPEFVNEAIKSFLINDLNSTKTVG